VLSEYAALGFEYGYSVANKEALVLWEAQFGDFVNGAQVVIDQYLVAAEDKWGQTSGLVLLLPHGYEGQGPEHSSARIERFLSLSAEDNIQVVNATTAAQYFHLLRRQVLADVRKPSSSSRRRRPLRMRESRSPIDELTHGSFQEVLDDPGVTDPARAVRRLVFCSGKVAWDALAERDKRQAPSRSSGSSSCSPSRRSRCGDPRPLFRHQGRVWLQEEPENMGGWAYVEHRMFRIKYQGYELRHVPGWSPAARPPARDDPRAGAGGPDGGRLQRL
jgi:2-oxoglutarate dehydrogenase E1 component